MNTLKKGSLRRGIAMAYMALMLTSTLVFAEINQFGLNAADAQVDDNCQKLPILSVVASGEEVGNVASNAVDMDPTTRWSNFGKGSFIQANLGSPTTICSVDISWLYGDSRMYDFVISVSNDGVNFNDIVSTKSSGDTNSAERYVVPQVTASYVRVTVYGNNVNDWTNISEMAIYGIKECTAPQISDVTAIGDDGAGNIPENTLDKDLFTRWSNNGFPSWIQYDLVEPQLVCDVDISMYRGSLREVSFTISTSLDGVNFTPIFSGQSSGQTIDLERYDVPDTMAKYVRITVTGNTENSWSSITEVEINGGGTLECRSPQISDVTAIGDDGNVPENTLDKDLFSRWSNNGFPSWIQYDLVEPQLVCDVDISMYRGSLREVSFTISTSLDGVNFTPIFSGQSSGQTIDLESYDVPDTMAKYVRITVTGNTENSWSSITEVEINKETVPTPTPTPPPTTTDCKAPQISDVTAIGDDGNVPENTRDNNLDTRWSNNGFPSWIQYDLVEPQLICDVDIAMYRGSLREVSFTISTSLDGVNFTPIFSGQSSGQTIDLESYDVPDTMAKYVRITVTGNTENSWSSITEVKLNDETGSTPAPAPVPTPTPTPTPGSDEDPFGIEKIYPTKAGGEEWFMDMSDGKDSRSNPPSLSKNSDGSFQVTSSKVRYGVFTSSGYDGDDVEVNHGVLAQRGYMQSPNDWKNVEMTGYVKVNDADPDENFAWYARGGRHTGSGWQEGCEGVAYKPDLHYDGNVRFAKEQWHVSYEFTDQDKVMSPIEGKWVGFKAIMYNMEENGETVVKMEIWLDKNNDGNWEKVDENVDRGGWGNEGEECRGEDDQIITWGGPIATFRWDGADDVDIRNFSVREIEPPV